MAVASHEDWTVLPLRGDPIRIVPVHSVGDIGVAVHGAPPAVAPQLTYRNGPLITAVEVFTVFWGHAWSAAANTALAGQLNTFFDDVLASALIDQLAEYSVPGSAIGHGRRTGTATVTSPQPRRTTTDGAIQHLLQTEIGTNHAFPQPTPQTLYFVYLPPGVAVSQGGTRSCQAFCGYHNDIGGQIFYAVMPYAGCAGCTGGMSVIDAMTVTSSHELCEAITDPIPGQGWYDDNNGEIGDICAWTTKTVAGHMVQKEWSNAANSCV